MEKLKRCVDYVCMCTYYLHAFLPMDFKEQAGTTQGFHNHVHDPSTTFLMDIPLLLRNKR
jgi:hypothetical protein